MDKDRFDSLTKALAEARSRRAAIGSLLGGAAAGLFTQIDDLGAKGKANKENSKSKKENSKSNKGGSKSKKQGGSKGKVTICHATGSASNPFVELTLSKNALKGHRGHAGDIIPAPAGGCPKGSNNNTGTTKPPKEDCQPGKKWCKATGRCEKAECRDNQYWDSDKCYCKPNNSSTTQAPSSTTKAPSSTTQAPSSTTKAPSSTTQAPSSTTKAPSSTTQGPLICTGDQSPKQCGLPPKTQYTCKSTTCPSSLHGDVEVQCVNGTTPRCVDKHTGADLTGQGCLPARCSNLAP